MRLQSGCQPRELCCSQGVTGAGPPRCLTRVPGELVLAVGRRPHGLFYTGLFERPHDMTAGFAPVSEQRECKLQIVMSFMT